MKLITSYRDESNGVFGIGSLMQIDLYQGDAEEGDGKLIAEEQKELDVAVSEAEIT